MILRSGEPEEGMARDRQSMVAEAAFQREDTEEFGSGLFFPTGLRNAAPGYDDAEKLRGPDKRPSDTEVFLMKNSRTNGV